MLCILIGTFFILISTFCILFSKFSILYCNSFSDFCIFLIVFFLCIFRGLLVICIEDSFTFIRYKVGVHVTLARHALILITKETINVDASKIMIDLLLGILIIIQEFLAL